MKTIDDCVDLVSACNDFPGDAPRQMADIHQIHQEPSTITQTVGRATVGDTIDGAASTSPSGCGSHVQGAVDKLLPLKGITRQLPAVSTWTVTGTLTGPDRRLEYDGLGLGRLRPRDIRAPWCGRDSDDWIWRVCHPATASAGGWRTDGAVLRDRQGFVYGFCAN